MEKKITELTEQLMADKKHLEEQMKVIGGLSREYMAVWLVKVPQMTLALYRNEGTARMQDSIDFARRENSYAKGFERYANDYVHADDRAMFLQSVSYENVSTQITQMPVYKVIYRHIEDGKTLYY